VYNICVLDFFLYNLVCRRLLYVLFVILSDLCYCIVLYCIVLYCTVLHCSTLSPNINPFAIIIIIIIIIIITQSETV